MKALISIGLWVMSGLMAVQTVQASQAGSFDGQAFAKQYFKAWQATQTPTATSQDVENYLALLSDDVGHQHLPYAADDSRNDDGKATMRKGMIYYLAAHTEYRATLVSHTLGDDVVVIVYDTRSKGIHPQTKQALVLNYRTLEVLEIENGKVSVIRKYSK